MNAIAARSSSVIGRSRWDVSTPALILDRSRAQRNINAMAAYVRDMGVALRPHIKVHKSPDLARMQIGAGAIGVAAATAWEALAMARGGISDVFVANEIVGRAKLDALVEAARHANVSVAVDDGTNVRDLAAAANHGGVAFGVLIDVDTGMGRCGVRSPEEAVALARSISALADIELLGVSGYEGHCMLEPDLSVREREARRAIDYLLSVVDELAADGHESRVVSAGGTGTYNITGLHPRVTELQAGSYVVMDAFHASLVAGFEEALTVQATVISRHGNDVVLDAGRKAVSPELVLPRPVAAGETIFIHEEHTGVRLSEGTTLAVGDRLELVPGYSPGTVNLYDVMHVVENETVVDLWRVHARYGRETLG